MSGAENISLSELITWGARSDQSESWIAVEYILYSMVTRSETALSEAVELNCNIEGSGASDAGAVGGGGGFGHL